MRNLIFILIVFILAIGCEKQEMTKPKELSTKVSKNVYSPDTTIKGEYRYMDVVPAEKFYIEYQVSSDTPIIIWYIDISKRGYSPDKPTYFDTFYKTGKNLNIKLYTRFICKFEMGTSKPTNGRIIYNYSDTVKLKNQNAFVPKDWPKWKGYKNKNKNKNIKSNFQSTK